MTPRLLFLALAFSGGFMCIPPSNLVGLTIMQSCGLARDKEKAVYRMSEEAADLRPSNQQKLVVSAGPPVGDQNGPSVLVSL